MARNDDDLELDVSGSEEKKSGGSMKIVIIIVAVLLLIGIGVTAALLLMGEDEPPMEEAAEMSADKKVEADEEAVESPKPQKKKKVKRKGKPNFLDMTPAFVVNLNDTESDVKFLQVSVSLMSFSTEDMDLIREYVPLIKNKLVLLFSEQKFNELRTKKGKEKLQAEALLTVQEALTEMTGKELVDALYITSIVGQ